VVELVEKAGPPPGLYPAEWLAAEAERLEQEDDEIEHATDQLLARLRARGKVFADKKAELHTAMLKHYRAARELRAQIEVNKQRAYAEFGEPWDRLKERRNVHVGARERLFWQAMGYGAHKVVTEVFDRHEKRRKEEASSGALSAKELGHYISRRARGQQSRKNILRINSCKSVAKGHFHFWLIWRVSGALYSVDIPFSLMPG
jgi:hypothetical protein